MPGRPHYTLDRDRYTELKARCRRYPAQLHRANSYIGPSTALPMGETRSTGPGDPTAHRVMKREELLAWCEPIEKAAQLAGGGRWYKALMLNCCYGKGLEHIPVEHKPSCNRATYFKVKKEFFQGQTGPVRSALGLTSDSESLDSPSEASGGACPRRRPQKEMIQRTAKPKAPPGSVNCSPC